MGKARFYCKCGCYFSWKSHLIEHIGICNPKWPRVSPEDAHSQITKEEWSDKRIASYRRLREG
jgi:hypothetical protein